MLTKIRARFAREEGQTMAEYAVVLSGGISGAIGKVTGIL